MFMINFRIKWLTRYCYEIGIKENFRIVAMLLFSAGQNIVLKIVTYFSRFVALHYQPRKVEYLSLVSLPPHMFWFPYYYYYYPCYRLYAGFLQLFTWNKPCFTVYSVAAVLYLRFLLHVTLFRPLNMFRTFKLALSVYVCMYVCVQCPIWLFW
jgi:hypothetical protein